MKFTEVTMEEALKYVTKKEYLSIYEKRATEDRKFKLWIWLAEAWRINALEITLPKFYS